MWSGIWYFFLGVFKCDYLIVEMKSLTVHKGSIINYLSPLGPMMDWVEGSAPTRPSVEAAFDPSVSKSLSFVEDVVADGFLSSLEVPRSF